MRFLSGLQNETVVGSQRERIGGEFIQLRLPEANRRLHVPRSLVLAQNVGDVIGAEGAGAMSFLDGGGDRLGTVVANQLEQLTNLAGE